MEQQSQNFAEAAIETIDFLQEDIRQLQSKRVQGDYWILFSRELMAHLPEDTIRACFLETKNNLLEVFSNHKSEFPNLGPQAQDALMDWSEEVKKTIRSVKQDS